MPCGASCICDVVDFLQVETMTIDQQMERKRIIGQRIVAIIVAATILTGGMVLWQTNVNPRTDDATVYANLIGIAPEVDGPIVKLFVRDNQLVKQGELLFEIDARPFEYALEHAKSEQEALEKRIVDLERTISAQKSAVSAAQAGVSTSEANVSNAEASISAAKANVGHAEAGVSRAEAESKLASDILHRVEPLLEKQYVTVDEVDRARTADMTAAEALRQARAQLELARAQLQSALAQKNQTQAGLKQSGAQLEQSVHNVTTIEPLTAQRGALASAVRDAQYRLDRCRVVAPFDARVTSLTISEGAYAHTGQQIFTLIDVRNWWVIGNYRESQLNHIRPGMPADVYVFSKPTARLQGKVDSLGFGVIPEGTSGSAPGSLPNVERTLNWVHLATRFPVRVRVESNAPDLLRIGESASVTVRGDRFLPHP
jgi:membrane fusion protein, multidrug efflux system